MIVQLTLLIVNQLIVASTFELRNDSGEENLSYHTNNTIVGTVERGRRIAYHELARRTELFIGMWTIITIWMLISALLFEGLEEAEKLP